MKSCRSLLDPLAVARDEQFVAAQRLLLPEVLARNLAFGAPSKQFAAQPSVLAANKMPLQTVT